MDGASRAIAREPLHLKRFVDHALSRHRGVAMDQNRQDFIEVTLVFGVAFGAGNADHHRIHRF